MVKLEVINLDIDEFMEQKHSVELKLLNTFRVDALAEHYVAISTLDDAKRVLTGVIAKPITILGGGSNTLFVGTVSGTVIHNQIKGIRKIEESAQSVYLEVGGGENWHEFVSSCVENGYGGIENLALIPGTVGASPVQNVGAYGVEVRDVIARVHTLSLITGEERTFTNEECDFSYRGSVFTGSLKGKYLITAVVFKLEKYPLLQTEYAALEQLLEQDAGDRMTWTIKSVFDAVVKIRKAKLPDPNVIGNAGSFFKNPIVDQKKYTELQAIYPHIPGHVLLDGSYKIPAGWLIEAAGWKQVKRGSLGVHEKQALVITHKGGATGLEIYKFSEDIRRSVMELFNIELEREINIVPALVGII